MRGVILDIPNARQLSDGLCWAACVAPVVTYLTGQPISQYDLAAAAGRRASDGATIADIRRALGKVAGVLTCPTRPCTAEAAFTCLARRRPILLIVDIGQGFTAHSVCLRGLIRTGEWHAVVNEPNLAGDHALFVPFARLRAAWRESLVIFAGAKP